MNEDRLEYLLKKQKHLQKKIEENYKFFFKSGEDAVVKNAYWSICELTELIEECGIYDKPWKSREININAIKEELIDVLHFILNIFIYLGMDAEEIIKEYDRKWLINFKRHNLK